MSMISSQCDELRELAKVFPEASTRRTLLMQAADTIWELSCKLAGVVDQSDEIERLKAENVKLREFSARLYKHLCITEGYMRGSGYDSFDYYDARMRELRIGEGQHVND